MNHRVGIGCIVLIAAVTYSALGQGAKTVAWPPVPPLAITPDTDAGELPTSVTAKRESNGKWACTFRHKPAGGAKSVSLAGSFNAWNRDAQRMTGPDADGQFVTTIPLDGGRHEYKFVVNGDQWRQDPLNPRGEPDGHSGQNSVLALGRRASETVSRGVKGDGKIDTLGLQHASDSTRYLQPMSRERVLMRYRTYAHDVESVRVVTKGGAATAMHIVDEGPLFTLFEAEIALAHDASQSPAKFEYTFELRDGMTDGSDPQTYTAAVRDAQVFETPDWAKNAIWYQIMVDRFRNGDPKNDPDPKRPWTSEWFTPSPFETATGESFYKHFVFVRLYGGDIAGLESKLDYLKDLGINAIYLNPVFKAESHHKYDATDYVHIDDHFGTKGDFAKAIAHEDPMDATTWTWTESDKRFLAFIKTAHAKGFRVIIDGVFNHVGKNHRAFQDVMKNGKASRFADWFQVDSWEPFKYTGWAGVESLPAFRKDDKHGIASEGARKHIFAVTRRWMDPNGDGDPSDGIDGWRLDVPSEIPQVFWSEWRKLVKSINPQAYTSGEIWDPAENWVDGKTFDAVMNYQFAKPVLDWAINRQEKIAASELDRRLRELRLAYPQAATYVMQNLVDSHDTDRLASMAHNPDRAYDQENRVQDNGPKYDNAKPTPEAYARARLVALVQATYVGAPMIYYGDEVGMWGADDPSCRKPMLWEDLQPYDKPEENFVMREQFEWYRSVLRLRGAHSALRTGSFETLLADDAADVWAFRRADEHEQLIVALRATEGKAEVTIELPAGAPRKWNVLFGGTGTYLANGDRLAIPVAGFGGIVLLAAPE